MACEICGKNSCTRSFHTIEVQNEFDEIADNVKDRMRNMIKARIERLNDMAPDSDLYLVRLDEVIAIIEAY